MREEIDEMRRGREVFNGTEKLNMKIVASFLLDDMTI